LASTTEKINATNENEAAFLRNLDCHYTNTWFSFLAIYVLMLLYWTMILIIPSKTVLCYSPKEFKGEVSWSFRQCWILCFQMKPNASVVCRVAILTCSFISNILDVTPDGECCCLQSTTVLNESSGKVWNNQSCVRTASLISKCTFYEKQFCVQSSVISFNKSDKFM
jgi:hypothetical protein